MGPTCVLPGSHTEEFYATHGNDSAWEEGLACLRRHCGAPQQAAAEHHEPPPAAAPLPAVLLADGSLGNAAESEPARGPDSAARERAHQQLVELAWQGTGPSREKSASRSFASRTLIATGQCRATLSLR